MKFEYTGSWFRIVVEIFHCRAVFARHPMASRRNYEWHRRKVLCKVIHKIGEQVSGLERAQHLHHEPS
jgi:hypothetical protein